VLLELELELEPSRLLVVDWTACVTPAEERPPPMLPSTPLTVLLTALPTVAETPETVPSIP
jgi:hypothetical protein